MRGGEKLGDKPLLMCGVVAIGLAKAAFEDVRTTRKWRRMESERTAGHLALASVSDIPLLKLVEDLPEQQLTLPEVLPPSSEVVTLRLLKSVPPDLAA